MYSGWGLGPPITPPDPHTRRYVYEISTPEIPPSPPCPKDICPSMYDELSSYFFSGGWRALLGILTCMMVLGLLIWLGYVIFGYPDVRLVIVQFYMICAFLGLVAAVTV